MHCVSFDVVRTKFYFLNVEEKSPQSSVLTVRLSCPLSGRVAGPHRRPWCRNTPPPPGSSESPSGSSPRPPHTRPRPRNTQHQPQPPPSYRCLRCSPLCGGTVSQWSQFIGPLPGWKHSCSVQQPSELTQQTPSASSALEQGVSCSHSESGLPAVEKLVSYEPV